MLDGANGDMLRKMLEDLKQEDSVIRSQMNDNRILKAAEYEATKGLMVTKVTPEQLQNKFVEFKTRVLNGAVTLKQLEEDVYTRWGVQEVDRTQSTESTVVTGFSVDELTKPHKRKKEK